MPKAYGRLMMAALEEVDVGAAEAREIIRNLVIARACREALAQLHDGTVWEETALFDTFDHIEAKFVLHNMLAEILQGDLECLRVKHCVALSSCEICFSECFPVSLRVTINNGILIGLGLSHVWLPLWFYLSSRRTLLIENKRVMMSVFGCSNKG